jgi:hypothetical protein
MEDDDIKILLTKTPEENVILYTPNKFITFNCHKISINQYKFLNILLLMLNKDKTFMFNNYNYLDATIKNKLGEKFSDTYVISINHLVALLGKHYNKTSIINQIEKIKDLQFYINKAPFTYRNNIISTLCNMSDEINLQIINDFIFIKIKNKDSLLLHNYKNYNKMNLCSVITLNSLYAMKIYQYINMFNSLEHNIINNYNVNFMHEGGILSDYINKVENYNNNIEDFDFVNKDKIQNIHIFDKVDYLLYILHSNIQNFKYNISEFKFFIENAVCAEINNKFIEGLKFLYENENYVDKIKENVNKYWKYPRYLVRCLWLKKHKIMGGGNANSLRHPIFQYYDILDINFNKMFEHYRFQEVKLLNFHKSKEN